jgi:hypothetical protein
MGNVNYLQPLTAVEIKENSRNKRKTYFDGSAVVLLCYLQLLSYFLSHYLSLAERSQYLYSLTTFSEIV